MDKCCSKECIAYRNWTLDRRRTRVPTLVTYSRVRGDPLYNATLSAKRHRCRKKCGGPSSEVRGQKSVKKCRFQTIVGAAQETAPRGNTLDIRTRSGRPPLQYHTLG